MFKKRIGNLAYLTGILFSLGVALLNDKIPLDNSLLVIFVAVLELTFCFSVIIRRLHDLNRSGWWSLTIFIPLANVILGIYLIFQPGSPSSNKFGPPPPKGFNNIFMNLLGSI